MDPADTTNSTPPPDGATLAPSLDDDIGTFSEKAKAKERRRILKNIILISFAFLCVFTAFQGLSRLQSSLLRTDGMGVITLSVLYATLVVSCLLIPKLLISAIGHKWTIPLSFSGYIIWMAANGYATWYTMVPASIMVGICAAPLWTAQCSYFTKIAGRYAALSGEAEHVVVTRFFGIFFMFFQFSGITGSIITATILKPKTIPGENETLNSEQIREFCGVNDCPQNNVSYNTNLEQPSSGTVWTMLGVFIGIAVLAVLLVIVAVDKLPLSMREDRKKAKQEVCKSLINTVIHLKKPNQCILIPLTMYSGFEQAFYSAEWTGSFVSCGIGIWKVGLVTLSFGVVNTVVSMAGGHIVKYIGRLPVLTVGMLVDLAIQLTLILWPLDKDKEYFFYIISGLWGLTDGIWQTQINALYGSIFSDTSEAAFSNYRMWESFGFIIPFAYSGFICTNFKVYILLCVLLVGMMGYYIVEWRHRQEQKLTTDAGKPGVDMTNTNTDTIKNGVKSNPIFVEDDSISTRM
ncbi:hypothetical protein LSH36_256g04070 [Paralvinella palmiformis]|uniref:UNC93-like protein n=1 Tax=Paralvinella palmiformis TaxID=53620 RepID=A0AAD9JKP8_9ANNE|nr:hypothetical protein LSH36_256g04070 [Paralvinella palmiformis]